MYQHWADGEGYDLLEDAQRATDVRVIPILVQALKDVPAARTDAHKLQETLAYYALVARFAVRREVLRQGLENILEGDEDIGYQVRNVFRAIEVGDLEEEGWSVQARRDAAMNVDELLATVRLGVEKDRRWDKTQYIRRLLNHDHPRALDEYLGYLDAERRITTDWQSHKRLSSTYQSLLSGLFPKHPAPFFERIRQLLKSNLLTERAVAVELLNGRLNYRFGLDAKDPLRMREEKLRRVAPLLKALEGLSENDIYRYVLDVHGWELRGAPQRDWLPRLKAAAIDPHPAVSCNALRLIGVVLDEPKCVELNGVRSSQRARALDVMIEDRTPENTLDRNAGP